MQLKLSDFAVRGGWWPGCSTPHNQITSSVCKIVMRRLLPGQKKVLENVPCLIRASEKVGMASSALICHPGSDVSVKAENFDGDTHDRPQQM